MSAFTIKAVQAKIEQSYAEIMATFPLDLRPDAKGMTYKYLLSTRYRCDNCTHKDLPCHISTPRPSAFSTMAVPIKRMELSWEDGQDDDYTGSQLWVIFTLDRCECCAVTYAKCSNAGRVIAFSCLPRHERLWSWCLVRECLPYWGRALASIGRNNLDLLAPLHWSEQHAALTEFWAATIRMRQIKEDSGGGAHKRHG